ncbi:Phosphatidylinositol 3,5-bisphosphate-binding protein, partial [Cryomyces antarcticus]
MNTRRPINELPGPAVLSVSFSADKSLFAAGLDNGQFRVHNTKDATHEWEYDLPFHNVGKSPDGGGVAGTAILDDKVAIFAVLGGGLRPHCAYEEFEVWEKEKLVIQCKLPGKSFQSIRMISEAPAALPDAVVKVKYLVAAAYDLVCLYEDPLIDPSGRPVLAQPEKFNTVLDNVYGLCCLSRHLLVIPSRTKGQVQLIKLKGRKEGRTISIVRAHDGPLRALELSRDGTLLATASTKVGSVKIRYFSDQALFYSALPRR